MLSVFITILVVNCIKSIINKFGRAINYLAWFRDFSYVKVNRECYQICFYNNLTLQWEEKQGIADTALSAYNLI